MNPRVLMLSAYYESHGGGVELVAGHLARGLAARGIKVTWMAADVDRAPPTQPGLELVPLASWNGIEKRSGIPLPLPSFAALRALRHQVGAHDVLLIHDALYLTHLAAVWAARRLDQPILLIQHVGDVPYQNRLAHGLVRAGNAIAARWAMRIATRVVFISRKVQQWFGGQFRGLAGKSSYIANGVDLQTFVAVSDEQREARKRALCLGSAPTVLFVGRFVPKKGVALLRRLAAAHPAFNFVFVGSGPLDPAVGSCGNVHVLGRLDALALAGWYQAADLLILPSVGEGFPLVVQEALACGLPALVSADTYAACPEFADGLRGTEVSGSDVDIENWSRVLQESLGASAGFATRATLAARAAELWSWDNVLQCYAKLIFEVTARRPPGLSPP